MSCEIELKYSLPENLTENEVFAAADFPSPIDEIKMVCTYLDTEDNALGKTMASLRHRMENDVSVFTVKTPGTEKGALARRGEWEVAANCLEEALPLLLSAGVDSFIIETAKKPLFPVAKFEYLRKCAVVRGDDFSAELCVDIGYLSPDGIKCVPLREVELELIDGDPASLCKYGEILMTKLSLTPEHRSKLFRARNLK
ncbi:MAG: CYTH domain-containing protein [Clostridia bacterium]|nr:CYTH domain-containing protein [Clostridia bacterium]